MRFQFGLQPKPLQFRLWRGVVLVVIAALVFAVFRQLDLPGLRGSLARLVAFLAIASPWPLIQATQSVHRGRSAALAGMLGGAESGLFCYGVVFMASYQETMQSLSSGDGQLVQFLWIAMLFVSVISNAIWGFFIGVVVRMAVGLDYHPATGDGDESPQTTNPSSNRSFVGNDQNEGPL